MAVLERTIQQRRARVNVDSLLAFDGVDQYASAGVNPNVELSDQDFAISLFFFKDSSKSGVHNIVTMRDDSANGAFQLALLGTDLFFSVFGNSNSAVAQTQDNNWNHVVAIRQGNQSRIYVNVIQSSDTGVISSGVKSMTQNLEFGREAWRNQSFFKGAVGHISFFNRALIEPEISYIHRYGGLLPQSTHAPCVAHYRTRTSGKVIDDLVEDYNPAKVAAGVPTLTAYPANLINFTDAQVGIPNQSSNTAYLDFYDKTPIII